MSGLEQLSPEEFEHQVRECLAHLYDYSFLREQPLVGLLVPDVSGATQLQIFRQIVTETVERLRPETGAAFSSKQGRGYNILTLRYIDQLEPQRVMQQLGLSERQFYRDHPRAIQTLSQLLWERITGAALPRQDAPPSPVQPSGEISVESEVHRVHSQAEPTQVDLRVLLQGALSAVQSLANQHGVALELDVPGCAPVLGTHGNVLRQVVLLLLSHSITRFDNGGALTIRCAASSQSYQIEIELTGDLGEHDSGSLHKAITGHKSLETLIDTVEGTLRVDGTGDHYVVTLNIPLRLKTILLVDDNPGMTDLFQRWLIGQPYHVVTASDGALAVQIARQAHPSLIILDVMLPGTDGWEVLQNLKNHPATQDIPVLVCSVLDACDLALSLGADSCLMKPPSQDDFHEFLRRWQA